MEGQLAVPFHFAVEFLVLVVACGAAFDSLRAWRHGGGARALGQAAAFGALAAAQVAHGTLMARADADPLTLALRTGGFLLLALVARPAAAVTPGAPTAVALGALFLPGVDADRAFVPAVVAAVVAARGVRAHRADQDPATFAFAAAFVAFAAAEAAVAAGPATGGPWLAAAHGARALGALFLARWLWTPIVRSVRMRFVASVVAVLTILALVVTTALNLVIGSTLQDEEQKRLEVAGTARVDTLQSLGQSGVGSTSFIAGQGGIVGAIARRDEPVLATVAIRLVRTLPANYDFLLFTDARGKSLGSSTNPTAPGRPKRLSRSQEIAIGGSDVVAEARDGRQSVSSESLAFAARGGAQTEIVVLAASPARIGSRVVGSVVVGYRVDRAFLAGVERDTGARATVIVSDRVVATTLGRRDAVERALAALRGKLRLAREEGKPAHAVVRLGATEFITSFVPVRSADGHPIGMMALSRPSDVLAEAQRSITRTLFLITLIGVAIASMLAWLSAGRVTRPIRALTSAARELRTGNLEVRTRVSSEDEVGSLGTAFNDMATELQRKTGDLERAAHDEATLRGRIEAILQSMGDALIATDIDGRVATFNRAAEELFRRKADAVLGRPLAQVLDGMAADGGGLADVAMRTGTTEGVLARGSKELAVAMSSAPLVDASGAPVGRVVLLRDMSAQYEAERMKSELLSNFSHEMRTPITGIKGYAELLAHGRLPRDKMGQALEVILGSTERLERAVDLMVDLNAMVGGRLVPRQEAVGVRALLDELLDRWRLRGVPHRFVRRVARGMPPILGDVRLIERSLDELVDNAVKFSPDGGVIEVGAEVASEGGRGRKAVLRLSVRDHGIGIPPERLADLFQDFRQLDGSDTRAFGGLGIGLAYVRRVAAAHGGQVAVESRPGKGSTFSLLLPAADEKGVSARAGAGAARRPMRTRAAAARRTAARRVATTAGKGRAKKRTTQGARRTRGPR